MRKKLLFIFLSSFVLAGCMKPTTTMQEQESEKDTLQFIQNEPQAPQAQEQDIQQQESSEPEGGTMEEIQAKQATISTSKGDVVIELYSDDAPKTVQNFLSKATTGFYENLTFHRVESWVVQGGDPRGNGTGGGQMATELNQRVFEVGSVGVARGGDINISNDSQFFICTDDCSWLTGQYTNFGKVLKGMDIVKKIQIGDTITKISYQ